MSRVILPLSVACVFLATAAPAVAAEKQDFVDFATRHCRAFVEEGRADMGFALGKAVARFDQEEMLDFNRNFAQKIIQEYRIDPAKGCVLDVVTLKQVTDNSHKPKARGRYAKQKPKHEIAVVAGTMGTQQSDAPVSVAYRLEQIGQGPWLITNVTLNGQPLVDRYREDYETQARKGGSKAVLDNL